MTTKDTETKTPDAPAKKDAPPRVTDTALRPEDDLAEITARHEKLLLENQAANLAEQPAPVSVAVGDKATDSEAA